ncbi:unnamed protein product [Adineta steineri]|uniref:Uncharacterized protein n=1 Tax=Adineta steineri TaxID=433720 RepID=A0A818TS61_9BILA|nr:unnamed protein product [Adineta steineri]
MQRVCFCKTVSLFNHILQPSQALAIFYQSLLFSLKNLELIKWISFNIDIPIGLQLLMIDINGNVTIDNDLFYKHLSNIKRDVEQRTDTSVILKWISRIVLRLTTDHSLSFKFERSYEFENFYNFLKQFHTNSTDDHSNLLNNDKRIINDDLDEEDISRRAIHCALIKCIDYAMTNSSNTLDSKPNNIEMQDFESNSIALYNQQILQILCSDTLELEIELAHDSHQSSFEILPQSSIHDHTLTSFYSTWAALWRDVTVEYLQFNSNKCLKKVMIDNFKHDNHSWSIRENDRILNEITEQQRNLKKPIIKSYKINENNFCLHDRLMFEIKQNKQLKPSKKSLTIDSNRKRIHPIQKLIESDSSSDDDAHRDEYGRKRVIVVDCLLESSPEDNTTNKLTVKKLLSEHNLSINTLTNKKTSSEKINHSTIENLEIEYISMEQLIRLMKDSSDTLSLTYDEFCHIRNVITRSELETLLFDEKLYIEVAQGKLCFTCRKVYFNILTFTFGIQCSVCKQKICRNCVKQITLPKERLNDLPIQAITPLTLSKSLSKSDRLHSLDTQSPQTPTMNDIISDLKYDDTGSRRCSTPGGMSSNQIGSSPWRTEPIDICTDCFFLLQQIRKKSRQHHVSPAVTSNLVSSTSSSSSFNRMQHSTSNYNLSSSSSASSIAALLAAQHQQRSLMVKTISVHSNLKQAKSSQELSANNDSLQTLTTTNDKIEKVSLSRRNLFLQLQPAYDVKLNNNNIKTG